MRVEAPERVRAVAGGEVAAEVADVQAGGALVAQEAEAAGPAGGRRRREQEGAGLVGRQELPRGVLAGHGGGGG